MWSSDAGVEFQRGENSVLEIQQSVVKYRRGQFEYSEKVDSSGNLFRSSWWFS